jgi:hypothetical protein
MPSVLTALCTLCGITAPYIVASSYGPPTAGFFSVEEALERLVLVLSWLFTTSTTITGFGHTTAAAIIVTIHDPPSCQGATARVMLSSALTRPSPIHPFKPMLLLLAGRSQQTGSQTSQKGT